MPRYETRAAMTRDTPVWVVEQLPSEMWRAELWVRPYDGWRLATTRIVTTQTWATRDGRRIFAQFREMKP